MKQTGPQPGWNAEASSTLTTVGWDYDPSYAINGILVTTQDGYWHVHDQNILGWFQLDLGAAHFIKAVEIENRLDGPELLNQEKFKEVKIHKNINIYT